MLAIIPARSGSKGLLDKNIKPLNKKPLIAWTIEAAQQCFDDVIVSTDSEEYAKIACEFGAKVPFLRSAAAASDTAGSWEVVREVIDKLETKYDVVALLQPTSPLRSAEDIQGALDLFREKDADVVMSVCEVAHPVEWTNTLDDSLSLHNFIAPDNQGKRRQDFEKRYMLNGAIYIIKPDKIGALFTPKSFAYNMPAERSVDIDGEADFLAAEAAMKKAA